MSLILLTLQCFLALVLASAGLHKLLARRRMTLATSALSGLELRFAAIASIAAAMIEASAAIMLLAPSLAGFGALIAALVWSLYLALLLRARHQGRSLDCGCDLIARMRPVEAHALLRAGVLILLAGGLALSASPAVPDMLPMLLAPACALGFFVLYQAIGALAAIPAPHWRNAQ